MDRAGLCEALAKEIASKNGRPTLFVRASTPARNRKRPASRRGTPTRSLRACREVYGLTNLRIDVHPPAEDAPAPHFALTAKIAARNGLKLLSMGMSADFADRDPHWAPRMCVSAPRSSVIGEACVVC